MQRKLQRVIAGATMGAALMGGVGSAHADVGYSAASCAAGAAKSGDLVTTRNGEAFNKNTSTALDVLCPVVLLNTAAKLDVSLFLKKATTAAVTCFVHSRYDDGSGGVISTASASGAGTKIVYIGNVSHFSTATTGCQLPKATSVNASDRTGIVSYFSSEY